MAWLKEHLPDREKLEQAAVLPLLLWIYILGFEIELSESVVVVGFYVLMLVSFWAVWRDVRGGPEEFIQPVE